MLGAAQQVSCDPAAHRNGGLMKEIDELDVLIRHRGCKVIAGIPQLGLYTKADDVASALDSLERKKEEFAAGLADVGEFDHFEWREPFTSRRGGRTDSLGRFAIKVIIVLALVSATTTGLSFLIAKQIQSGVKLGGHGFWTKFEKELDRAADPKSDLPEETKQKVLANIRTIVNRWRPFASEVTQILSEPAPSNPPPGPQHPK